MECDCCMLDEFEARQIAGEWHSGQFSSLYMFSSSGHLDSLTLIEAEKSLRQANLSGNTDPEDLDKLSDLIWWLERHTPEDTSEDACTEHGFDVCPDCGNGGIVVGSKGYESCTRFLTCWADPE